jgi:uncharacterized protein
MGKQINLISVAETQSDQEQGLQFVRHLADDSGMLFKYKHPRVLSFWMKNTYIPLDIAFLDDHGVIVKTERMIPLSLRSVSSERPCTMAIELAAGTLDRVKASVGSKVSIDLAKKSVTFNA